MKAARSLDLTEDQIADLTEAFGLFDITNDGSIGAEELHMVLMAIGRNTSIEETKKIIADIEANKPASIEEDIAGEGELDLDEFLLLMANELKESETTKDELEEAFERFGAKNIDDYITIDRLKETLERHGEKLKNEDLEHLFEMMGGASTDSGITFEMFCKYFMAR